MNYTQAIKNKVRSAAGAPGRAIVNRHSAYKQQKADKEYGFLKDYNAKSKRGVPTSPQEQAQFQMIKNRKY